MVTKSEPLFVVDISRLFSENAYKLNSPREYNYFKAKINSIVTGQLFEHGIEFETLRNLMKEAVGNDCDSYIVGNNNGPNPYRVSSLLIYKNRTKAIEYVRKKSKIAAVAQFG